MYCLNVITDDLVPLLGRLLESIARYLFFFIGKFIYGAIRYIYNIFVALCNGRILDNDSIMALFSRIGVILGVIMLFVVSFSVIQLLVDPDAIADKEKGIQNIVKKVIFVIIMLGVSGYVFNILTEVQAIVIERDIIPRLLLPKAVSTENVGGNLSAELFMIFYQVGVEPEDDACGETYRDSTKAAIANGDFTPVSTCLTAGSGEGDGWVFSLEYNWLFSTLFGIAALYMIFSYCITVGVRLIQLTFLQIISPAAIIGYLSPKKDNVFSKWVEIYFSTYIDVFIRIAIINFAMYLIALIMDGFNNQDTGFWASVGSPGLGIKGGLIAAIMIMAILQFAKKAPELIKQLLPKSASGIGFGFAGKDTPGLGMMGAGAAALGVSALATTTKIPGLLNKGKDVVNGFRNEQGAKNKAAYAGKTAWEAIKHTPSGLLGAVGAGGRTLLNTGKAAYTGRDKGFIGGLSAGQSSASGAIQRRNNDIKAGRTTGDKIGDWYRNVTGSQSAYDYLKEENSSNSDIKDFLEDQDQVKDAIKARDVAYEDHLKRGGIPESFDNEYWNGEIKRVKRERYTNLLSGTDNDSIIFKTKLEKHDRKYGTKYSSSTFDDFDATRKQVKQTFEQKTEQKKE